MRSAFSIIALIIGTVSAVGPCFAQLASPANAAASVPAAMSAETVKLEREKFEYQKTLEGEKKTLEWEKLNVERQKAWLTGGSILLPLALGLLTLYWQSKTANALRNREAKDAFDIKAAEIVFKTDSTVGTKNRAKALADLFPDRIDKKFGEDFHPSKFGGPRYEAKLEVFKAACEKVSEPEDVYEIWKGVFPEDKWIEPLLSKRNNQPTETE